MGENAGPSTPTNDASLRVGRLIAIDGLHGPDVTKAATTLYQSIIERESVCGISRWDASGLFGDVLAAPVGERDLSARTLLLLYAADLAFRLRWEIAPALAQGLLVVAAPYVATATAFGLATGLSTDWLASLFRFAPDAARTIVLREKKTGRKWKRRPDRGFGECCAALLEATPEGFARKKTRERALRPLSIAAETHGGLLTGRQLRTIAAELTSKRRGRDSVI